METGTQNSSSPSMEVSRIHPQSAPQRPSLQPRRQLAGHPVWEALSDRHLPTALLSLRSPFQDQSSADSPQHSTPAAPKDSVLESPKVAPLLGLPQTEASQPGHLRPWAAVASGFRVGRLRAVRGLPSHTATSFPPLT